MKLPAIQNEKSFHRDPATHASPAYSIPSASKFHNSKNSRMMTYERGASREYLMTEEERKERFYYEGKVYEKPPQFGQREQSKLEQSTYSYLDREARKKLVYNTPGTGSDKHEMIQMARYVKNRATEEKRSRVYAMQNAASAESELSPETAHQLMLM